eukprot:m.136142 g.136142  ORF g.136142 m.136142 type:complete len:243 (-) comp10463_c0_seq1:141-869(-)
MSDLVSSKQQLIQVEAALLTNPDDPALKQLASDLKEVIALQTQLTHATSSVEGETTSFGGWNIGDKCEAVWAQDGSYYSAELLGFESGGANARVKYTDYGDVGTVKIESLRKLGALVSTSSPAVTESAVPTDATVAATGNGPQDVKGSSKNRSDAIREKKMKKAKRRKEKEEEELKVLDKQKSSWQNFAKKAKSKKKSGVGKKSIFASPDDPSGRVGIGTCNIGGKGMTEYRERGKWQFDKK